MLVLCASALLKASSKAETNAEGGKKKPVVAKQNAVISPCFFVYVVGLDKDEATREVIVNEGATATLNCRIEDSEDEAV